MYQKNKYKLILVASIVLSLGGIAGAVYIKKGEEGGRGGAIAVAGTLFIFFLDPDYSLKAYQIVRYRARELREKYKKSLGEVDQTPVNTDSSYDTKRQIDELKKHVNDLVELITSGSKSQKSLNCYMAWASIVGTLAWGFGDLIAKGIIKIC